LRRPGLFLAVLVGISLATLFVKQHYVVDVAYGAGLAWLAWWMSGRLVRQG
jgi:membrane-associated phospholipid phosphatase